jgi:hypothetical protein
MNYLIAVMKDRIEAESAYTALEQAGISLSQVSILGKGYKTADEFGLIDPSQKARQNAIRMAYWLVPFGFFGGFTFDAITNLDTFAWAGTPGDHIIGGILGSIGGAMGSFFIGGGIGLTEGSGDALPYRNRLNEGKYLIIVQGSESLHSKVTPILRSFNPESLQGYTQE